MSASVGFEFIKVGQTSEFNISYFVTKAPDTHKHRRTIKGVVLLLYITECLYKAEEKYLIFLYLYEFELLEVDWLWMRAG
jgi:hypothetical protein